MTALLTVKIDMYFNFCFKQWIILITTRGHILLDGAINSINLGSNSQSNSFQYNAAP